MNYKPTIGLEVHVELNTQSKMFCSCRNNSDAVAPNSQICPICMAHPGTLPVANNEAIRKTIKTGLALNCKIAEVSKFDRKNYFYPDLPKGYQVSQYDMPFCEKGFLEISGNPPSQKASARQSPPSLKATARQEKIRITRIHLEEDTGRLIHSGDSSLVDFNRAGVPLMELVTEPDIASGKEARAFAQELQLILRYLGVSEADMEKGQMRVEVNISLSKSKKLGTKVEIKNLNSFRVVERAADYEIKRQTEVLEQGGKIIQETRGWNDSKGITFSQREKEEAHDYRYFPEPDLPVIYLDKKFIEEIRAEIPELPEQKRKRFSEEYGLEKQNVEVFAVSRNLSEYFEKVISEFIRWLKDEKIAQSGSARIATRTSELARLRSVAGGGVANFHKLAKFSANYLISDIQGLIGDKQFIEKDFSISPENFAEFITMIFKEEISSKTAKQVLEEMYKTGADPSHIIEEKGLTQLNDRAEIEKIIKNVISNNPKPVDDYKKGKEASLQFLVGKVMAQTRGRAKPDIVQKLLKQFIQ
ncbi:MAG: glutaminyl-tRNA synthase (glutamine-hydrolyzing) subunit B [Candidatus Nealsonbacteria bacterium RIFCSPHIGHO2_01_FULL_38_55]|uniref:Aspartyl/glutamyl-tRNA(Asn/Gln) amidotransferase subunit B n=1 Tax=Candidatus Nealsonbacteria bacterium RIFCSPHIGHO2_01_FULL_38_55 TaxID=1801664 RepID=A0A1G2E389_9BACT|nr:MAG: Aspartyl/glutamyl-tRNA(Asn/Gln) amidotransferase subunit B [Parcubacteria group bacterium GW2011_GWA2_38_27]KKQ97668.1 MAG: Aspartyl/glutamyl-tRNA(Asn/Gln) amidotransferase subunit B [Parcubacteria group bacterium GW2011_GWC2_39_11]OGZ20162.1 MAG: glutaminyl-tRNA synthase (glutamine-hydrolyzing) subunit B [Candidatus Nealsonbacteria bacterium RIFCSPHIGHO2_01_FULL_38_55]OGZ22665.1 MAG: glutaminyl-tRNA synthase (glutamine-hydrolyzing) subunit B [Candidatus Nealsonbacteria bacterium RIFCSPH